MTNLLISIIYLLISFSLTVLCYKYYGKYGLFIWMTLSVVICNIQTVKLSEILSYTTSLGNISYGSIFLTSDILSEMYGEKECQKSIILSFIGMIIFTILMTIFLQYIPSKTDTMQSSLEMVFSFMPRITLGSLTAYLLSQLIDARLYKVLKKKFNKVWISNNVSTLISQSIDTLVFTTISFLGVISFNELLELMTTMLIVKYIIAFLDTPFMIMVTKIKSREMC